MKSFNQVLIIAEIGQAHDGSLGMAHAYIDALAPTGVDAVKFQIHIAEAESSEFEPFRTEFSYEDKTRYDYWERTAFSTEQWDQLKDHCEKVGLEFIGSAFSNAAVNLLEKLGVNKYKVGSGEISNLLLLRRIAETGKDIILSSGMSTFAELDDSIGFLKAYGNPISLLQCTTKYPTSAKDVGLNVIEQMRMRYGLPTGLSDHSGTIYPALAATALGASIIEVHAVFDKRMFGPDTASSLTIDEIRFMVNGVRFIEDALKHEIEKNDTKQFEKLKEIFGKSLAVNKDLKAGTSLTFDDLESKKPFGVGIPARDFSAIIGKKLRVDKKKYEFLKYGNIT